MFYINGKLILNKMEEMGYNQHQFSKKIGTSQPTFSRMVNNSSTNINLEVLHNISLLLDLNINDLIITDPGYKRFLSNNVILTQVEAALTDLQNKVVLVKQRLIEKEEPQIPDQLQLNTDMVAETNDSYKIRRAANTVNNKDDKALLNALKELLEKERKYGFEILDKTEKHNIDVLYHFLSDRKDSFDKHLITDIEDKYISYKHRNELDKNK